MKRTKYAIFLGLIASFAMLSFIGITCDNSVQIESPPEGFIANDCSAVEIFIRYNPEGIERINVYLNGADVTEYLEKETDGARIDSSNICGYFVEGQNALAVYTSTQAGESAAMNVKIHHFAYDTMPPWFQIDELNDIEDNYVITGRVIEVIGVDEMRINDVPVEIGDGSGYEKNFEVTVPHSDHLTVYANDLFGRETNLSLSVPAAMMSQSASFRVNSDSFAWLANQLSAALIASSEFCNMATDTVLFSGSTINTSGQIVNYEVVLKKVSCKAPTFSLDTLDSEQHNELNLLALIEDIQIDLAITAEVVDGDQSNTETGSISLAIGKLRDLDHATLGVVENTLVPLAQEVVVTLEEFVYNSQLTPMLEQALALIFGDSKDVETIITDELTADIESTTKEVVAAFLAKIKYEGEIPGLIPTTLALYPEGIYANDKWLELGMKSHAAAVKPDPDIPYFPGSFYTPAELPQLADQTPTGKAYDLAMTIAENSINQEFYAYYNGGAFPSESFSFDLSMNSQAATLVKIISQLKDVEIPSINQLIVRAAYITPPWLDILDNGNLFVWMPQALLQFQGKDAAGKIYDLFELWVVMGQEASLVVLSENTIGLSFIGDPYIRMEVMPTSELNIPLAPVEDQITLLISRMLAKTIESTGEIKIPSYNEDGPVFVINEFAATDGFATLFEKTIQK